MIVCRVRHSSYDSLRKKTEKPQESKRLKARVTELQDSLPNFPQFGLKNLMARFNLKLIPATHRGYSEVHASYLFGFLDEKIRSYSTAAGF